MITKSTILKCGDKEYTPFYEDDTVFWYDENERLSIGYGFNVETKSLIYVSSSDMVTYAHPIVAQSKLQHLDFPVIEHEINPKAVFWDLYNKTEFTERDFKLSNIRRMLAMFIEGFYIGCKDREPIKKDISIIEVDKYFKTLKITL